MTTRRNKTSKPRFNLDGSPKSKENQLIFLVYRYKPEGHEKRIMLKYSTGIKTKRKYWDTPTQRIKHSITLDSNYVDQSNKHLFLLESAATRIFKENNSISINNFKKELDYDTGVLARPKSKKDIGLLEYTLGFIQRSDNHELTILKYQTAYNHLSKFEEYRESLITFDEINAEFADSFKEYLYKNTNVKSQTTVSKLIQNLKAFVNDAYENGYHSNTKYQSSKFTVSRAPSTKHFLEWEDLQLLHKYDFGDNHRLTKTRDIWLVAAYSGLRYSDFSRLNPEHFIEEKGVKMIQLNTYKGRTTKDDTEVVIPVIPELDAILTKYNYQLPAAYSSQKMNTYIKEACELAGINRTVITKRNIRGKSLEESTPLYSHVTNHTARYTFINIMINEFDIPPQDLMKITGQNLKVMMGYERGDKKKNAIKVYAKLIEALNHRKLKVVV